MYKTIVLSMKVTQKELCALGRLRIALRFTISSVAALISGYCLDRFFSNALLIN